MTTTPDDILRFWISEVGEAGWYAVDPEVDATIARRFRADWGAAEARVAAWSGTPEGALAAAILTDQFPRNMFRGDARAFATDPLALTLARRAIDAGQDLAIAGLPRQFFYLPFEHSEALADQDRAIALFEERLPEAAENLRHAHLHRDVIARFGRFPFRNAALGRVSTPDEQAFLDAGGYGALVRGEVTL